MSEQPLIAGPLYGLRTWRVADVDGAERLAAPHRGTLWPTGGAWLQADCERAEHRAPVAGCDCGIHGWHPRRSSARSILSTRREIPGVVEADGETEIHAEGFRAARGRVYAIFVPPGRNARLLERVAAAYGAEAVPVSGADDIVAWCRDRGLGLDEAVVKRLLGPEAETERRRRRRAILTRAAVAAAVVAVIAGGVIAIDPGTQHGKTLKGRNGEIRVP